MPRAYLPLAFFAASLLLLLAQAARAHDFSVDPTSPEVLGLRYGSSDVIDQTGGGPIIFASNLGLGSDELDGFSYGKDILRPVALPNFYVSLQFSVSRATLGAGQVVTTQRNLNGAAGDKFNLLILRNGRTIGPFLASDAPNHKLTPGAGSAPGQSEIDGLSFPASSKPAIYYTVARGGVKAASDIHYVADWTQGTAPVVFATAAQLGLVAGDNIDALAVKDGGTIGTLDSADVIYVSLDNTSPTRIARGGQDDVLQVWPAPIAVAVAWNRLDIQNTTNEEIDAITGYDPGPALLALLVGLPAQPFGMLMGDLERAGPNLAYFGIFNNTGYYTEIRPDLSWDTLLVVPTPFGSIFISPWHVKKGGLRPWSRGTGLSSPAGQESLRFYDWSMLGFNESIVVSEGDPIPGLGGTIAGFNRCHDASVGNWNCFSSGIFDGSFVRHWASWCTDPFGAVTASVWATPGLVVDGKTIQSLDRMDGATDPEDPNRLNFYGAAITTTGERVLLHTSVVAGPLGLSWDPLSIVIDASTVFPFAMGPVNSIGPIAAQSAAFHATTTGGQNGIYHYVDGELTRIADTTTPVPGGSGNFSGFFDDVSNDEGAVTFVGTSAGGSGIYTNLTGRLQKIVQVNDVLEGRTVSGVRLERDAAAANMVAFGVRFTDGYEGLMVKALPKTFDTSDATQRAIHVDVELDPEPGILGPDPRALLLGDLGTVRLRGIWSSNGTLGTVTIPGSEVARLLALQFGPSTTGGIGEWVITVDVATGAIVSSVARGTLANGPFDLNADTNGGPWTSPLIPGGIPGTTAGFETNGAGQKLFCSNAFSQIAGAACGAGAFGSPAASTYDAQSGFVHMTGPLTLGNVVLWGFLGDQRWLEAPPTNCAGDTDLDSDGVCDLVDNCVFEPNSGQQNVGGVGPGSALDASGDACQCGDVNADGRVTGLDGTLAKRAALGLAPYPAGVGALPAPNKCDVNGGATGDPVFRCSGLDGTLIQRASLGLPPGVQQACMPALP
ncbi:MAG TPA: hypothetical protein VFT98_03410 [Myxococcota bacterium]|nr:hypothetical protein [Myxococcota bacterium]